MAVLEERREGNGRSLKAREKAFFRRVAEEIGGHPAVLYSISKLLNEIGSSFVEDGIGLDQRQFIERTPDLASRELEVNTVYYLENLMRDYLLQIGIKFVRQPQIQHRFSPSEFPLREGFRDSVSAKGRCALLI